MTRHRTVAFSKQATNLFFHILTQCNLSCRHCYINPRQHGSGMMPLDQIRAWLKPFAARAEETNLVFLGGEPTLHPELPQAVRHARRAKFASITIDTNGYLFHDILERVTPREVDYFSFSLDGATAAVNDAIRGTGSYRSCLEGIRRARSRGFVTSLIYTVSRANLHELDRMEPLLRDLGVERFFIQVIGLRGKSAPAQRDAATTAIEPVTKDEWLQAVPSAARRIAAAGITVVYPKVFLQPGEIFECAGLVADNFFVFPNGRVYRCPLCEDYPVHGLRLTEDRLTATAPLNETDFFRLQIPEGCVMNKMIQPQNLEYDARGRPLHQIACCMLKEEIAPD
jgi:MoaA/NifB/PqqE/SkfB family radical SAM enzyme